MISGALIVQAQHMIIRGFSLVPKLHQFMFSKACCLSLDVLPDVAGIWTFVMAPDSVVTCIILGKNFMIPFGLCQTVIALVPNCMTRIFTYFVCGCRLKVINVYIVMQEPCFERN